ncbi:VOC family protein [Paenibacillus kribbensis]|uniref:VOC family protein n=1 Tax=Paenibacillus kribbensis TaxID=172713 RepID=UPI0015BA5C08|nr:VOC family protein [Paenibacillus kribbensis]
MTTIKWDHTVHYVNDLEQSIRIFQENGLNAFQGGSHKPWGTHNALCYFGLTYIEFLGIEDRELVQQIGTSNLVVHDALRTLPEKEVFSRVALRTNDIKKIAEQLTAQGLMLSPILDGKRLNTQGQWIEWRMMTIEGNFQGLVYPFIIQWKENDTDRLDNLTRSGAVKPHLAGSVELRQAVFSVPDPEATAAHWQALFGLSATVSQSTNKGGIECGIGDKSFIFIQGNEKRLTQLGFHTDSPVLKGKTIGIGEGNYVFE